MITGFVFDILPLWLSTLAALAKESWIYGLLRDLYHRGQRLVRQSFCGRLWRGIPGLKKAVASSGTFRLLDHVVAALVWAAGKLSQPFLDQAPDSFTVSQLSGSTLLGRIWNHPAKDLIWLHGIVFLVTFLCPGELWRNQFALLFSLVLFAATLAAAWREKRMPLTMSDLGLGLIGFMFASAVGAGVSGSLSEGIRVFCFYLTAYLLCMSMVGGISSTDRLISFLGFVYAALVLTGLYAIVQRIMGVEVNSSLTDLAANAGMPGRVYSTMDNPNNYAEFIVLTFPLSVVFCATIQDRRAKLLSFGGLLIPVVALLMTYSRSGWISFALAAVIFVALWDKRLLPLLAVGAVMCIPLLPQTVINRILTIGSTADSSNMYRIYIWGAVIRMIADHGLTGIGLGPGNFTPLYDYYCHPDAQIAPHSHMLYLEVWLEMGILGLVTFLLFYLGIIRRGIRRCPKARSTERLTLIACVSSLGGLAFISAVEYIWHYPRVLFCFFILIGVTIATLKMTKAKKS